jgi:hypothetical protein
MLKNMINLSHEICDKECLILLENHSILNRLFLVKVVPCAIGAFFAIASILKDPISIFVLYSRLHFGDQLVIDSDITIRGSAYNQFLLIVFANATK